MNDNLSDGTYVVRVSVKEGSLYVDTDNLAPAYCFRLSTFLGRFEFTEPVSFNGVPVTVQGELLCRECTRYSIHVYLEPEYVFACLSEDDVCSVVSAAANRGCLDDAWLILMSMLSASRAVSLATENHALARHLSTEAAVVYAAEQSMLAESWNLL